MLSCACSFSGGIVAANAGNRPLGDPRHSPHTGGFKMRFRAIRFTKSIAPRAAKSRRTGILIGLAAVLMIPMAGKALLQNTTPRNLPEFHNRQPDINDQERMRQQQKTDQNFEAVNTERKKKISGDSAELLKLATDLKADLDKASKDTLSL